MDVFLLWLLCVVRYRSLWRTDNSSRGVLPSVACLSVIVERHTGGLDTLGLSSHEKKGMVTAIWCSFLVKYHTYFTWNSH